MKTNAGSGTKSHKSMAAGPDAPAVITGKGENELKQLMQESMAKVIGHVDKLGQRLSDIEEGVKSESLDRSKADLDAGIKSDEIAEAVKAQADTLKQSFDARWDQIEAKMKLGLGQVSAPKDKSIAELIHDSEAFKSLPRNSSGRITRFQEIVIDNLPNALDMPSKDYAAKAITTMGSAELGPIVAPAHRPTPAELLTEFSDIISWITRVPVGGADTYDFPRETEASRLGYVRSTLAAGVVSGAGVVATFAEVEGFANGTLVRFHTTGGIETARIVSITGVVVTFDATLNFTGDIDDLVTSENYGGTLEDTEKPGAHYEFERPTVNLKTIAIILGLTQQRLDSLPQLQGLIESTLRRRARRNLSYHFLYGDDTLAAPREQLAGFASEVGSLTYTLTGGGPSGGTPPANDTRADAIVRAASFVHSGNRLVAHMNIREWNLVMLEKGGDDHYVHTQMGPQLVVNTLGMMALGSLLVNIDGAVQDADFFVIDHALASEYPINERASQFAVGMVGNDFLFNRLKVRWEDRLNHAILTTTAYIYGQMT